MIRQNWGCFTVIVFGLLILEAVLLVRQGAL
jgi:hypothetical protein